MSASGPARDESGRLLPHPYYWAPEYAEQRARDAANERFAVVLGEALRRMCAEHEGKAAEARWWSDAAERYPGAIIGLGRGFWQAVAGRWRAEAREQSEIAQIYRWFGHLIGPYGPPGVCTCRLELGASGGSRYCPHVPNGRYW
jgi:hypothetical protein